MSCSEIIQISCAIASLAVAVIIGVLQVRQNSRMGTLERRQDERDERRHAAEVRSQAVSFVSKHYENRCLVPLCAIATMHNNLFCYSREMYREFCCCTEEVQNRILEYCELDLRVVAQDSFYDDCLEALEESNRESFPFDEDLYYDHGKYILRSLESYGACPVPCSDFEYEKHLTDIIADAFRSTEGKAVPCSVMKDDFSFMACEEIQACQLATTAAGYFAIYSRSEEGKRNYGCPEDYGMTNYYMEDLFLWAMFHIYTDLILES